MTPTSLQPVVEPRDCVNGFGQWVEPMWKHADDLARYALVIARCRPGLIIESGTHTGASARWFGQHESVKRVVTIDVTASPEPWDVRDPVTPLIGDSASPSMAGAVAQIAAAEGLPTMVSLDADHGRDHVISEVLNYAPLVSPGQYLVIEDGVLAWLPPATQRAHAIWQRYQGTVLEAIEQVAPYLKREGFVRDTVVEALTGCTMNPFGWWRRESDDVSRPQILECHRKESIK